MKRYIVIFLCTLCFNLSLQGQVGINTDNPSAMLDVVGDVKTDGSLYLENPGSNSQIRDSKLLIRTTANNIIQYDIASSKYGPINYAQYSFQDLSSQGLLDYDTKISTADYIVTIQGYYFLDAFYNDFNLLLKSNVNDNRVEGYQIYAYENSATNTWFLRAFPNNSDFISIGFNYHTTEIDMYLNLIIYRRGFITKSQPAITVDMSNSTTGVASLPDGF